MPDTNSPEVQHMFDEIAGIQNELENRLADVEVYKAMDLINKSHIALPEGLDFNELVYSGAKGLAPDAIGDVASGLTGQNLDISSGIMRFMNSDPNANQMDNMWLDPTSMFDIRKWTEFASNPLKMFQKLYTDDEIFMAAEKLLHNRYGQSTNFLERETLYKAFQNIEEERGDWGYALRTYSNLAAELMTEVAGPFSLMSKGVNVVTRADEVVELGKKIASSDLVKLKPFKDRSKFLQFFTPKPIKYGDVEFASAKEMFGGAVGNVRNITATSIATQMLWDGADIDEAFQAGGNMFALETFNQAFGYMFNRTAFATKVINRALAKSKVTNITQAQAAYSKAQNILRGASSFPAQMSFTFANNLDASEQELAGELMLNAIMTRGTFVLNRKYAGQIRDEANRKKQIAENAERWASDAPTRKIEVVKEENLQEALNDSEYENTGVLDKTESYDAVTGVLDAEYTVIKEKETGFYGFAKSILPEATDNLTVGSFKKVLDGHTFDDPVTNLITNHFETIEDVKIRAVNRPNDKRKAYYNQQDKTIYFNNGAKAIDANEVRRAVIHEGVHALIDGAYKKDKAFQEEITNVADGLFKDPDFIASMDEMLISDDNKKANVGSILDYIHKQPSTEQRDHEFVAMLFDTDMGNVRDYIIDYAKNQEEPVKWYKKLFNAIKKYLGKGKEEGEIDEGTIQELQDFVLGYSHYKVVSPQSPSGVSAGDIINAESLNKDIVFMPNIDPTARMEEQLSELNKINDLIGIPNVSADNLALLYEVQYGNEPNAIQLGQFIKRKTDELNANLEAIDNESALENYNRVMTNRPTINPADIKYAVDVFGVSNMDALYDKTKDKSYEEVFDIIKNEIVKSQENVTPELIEEASKIAAVKANNIKNIRKTVPYSINENGRLIPIYSDYYLSTKPVDKTMGRPLYFDNFLSSLRDMTSEASYATPEVNKLVSGMSSENLHPLESITTSDNKSKTKFRSQFFQGEEGVKRAARILEDGVWVLPRGGTRNVLLKLNFMKELLNDKAKAIQLIKDVKAYGFGRWLDSDSAWQGPYKANRKLVEHIQLLDMDLLARKYLKGDNNVSFLDIAKGDTKIEEATIKELGYQLRRYYTDAYKKVVPPTIYDLNSESNKRQISIEMLDALTDLYLWGLDMGGSSRTLDVVDKVLKAVKTPLKYHTILGTDDNILTEPKALEPFIPKSIRNDTKSLEEAGIKKDKDGNYTTSMIVVHDDMLDNSQGDFLKNYFADNATDGASFSLNPMTFQIMTGPTLPKETNIGALKPKYHNVDSQGNGMIYKTAIFDIKYDEYNDLYNPDTKQFFENIGEAVPIMTFTTSSKGDNTSRYTEHLLRSEENPDALALFNSSGQLAKVVVDQGEGNYKTDEGLKKQELEYMRDNFQQGIVDDRMIVDIPLTGTRAVSMVGTSKDVTKSEAGAFGANGVLTYNPAFPFWQQDGGKGFKAIEDLETRGLMRNVRKIRGITTIRNFAEGMESIDYFNYQSRKMLENLKTEDELIEDTKFRTTPKFVRELKNNEVFVFGSNEAGIHGAGAALQAKNKFGAVQGQGVGLQGSSYGIPTKNGDIQTLNLDQIKEYVGQFIEDAKKNPFKRFYVTEIGTGLAGYKATDIAPFFEEALAVSNIFLPESFWNEVTKNYDYEAKKDELENRIDTERQKRLENYGFNNPEKLEEAADVIKDMIEKYDTEGEEAVGFSYMTPGYTRAEVVDILRSMIATDGTLKLNSAYKFHLLGDLFSGRKFGEAGKGSQINYQFKNYAQDALKTNTFGQNLVLMPDIEARASVARLYEPLIEEAKADNNLAEAERLQDEYELVVEDNITEDGRLEGRKQGVILNQSTIDQFNLKPGQRLFLKLTPTDDLHSIVPVILIGASNKPGMITFNKEYLTEVIGRDFDIDKIGFIAQNDQYISNTSFTNLWNLYTDQGMYEGQYKDNSDEFNDRSKTLGPKGYDPFVGKRAKKFELKEPIKTPQSNSSWEYSQSVHSDPGITIALRNNITSAFLNSKVIRGKNVVLKLPDFEVEGMDKQFSGEMNFIVQKSFDNFDLMPINPEDALIDLVIDEVFVEDRWMKYEDAPHSVRKKARSEANNLIRSYSNADVKKLIEEDGFSPSEQFKIHEGSGGETEAVTNKVADILQSTNVNTGSRPEIRKYIFRNELNTEISKESEKKVKELAQVWPSNIVNAVYNNYPNTRLSIPQHLRRLFLSYNRNNVNSNDPIAKQKKDLAFDLFSYINNDIWPADKVTGFKPFEGKNTWMDIAVGTVLNDHFNVHEHRSEGDVTNRIYKGEDNVIYEYIYDGFNGHIRSGDNQIELKKIFDEGGNLTVDWIDGKTLRSPWIRKLVERKSNTPQAKRGVLIGKTVANVAKRLGLSRGEINPNEIFITLSHNNPDEQIGSKWRPKGYEKNKDNKPYFDKLHRWIYKDQWSKESKQNILNIEKSEPLIDFADIFQGARMMGVNPEIRGNPYQDYLNQYAEEKANEALGDSKNYLDASELGMPNLKYTTEGLDVSTSKFIKSINKMLAERPDLGFGITDVMSLNEDNYRTFFQQVLGPQLEELITKEGKKQKWSLEKIENTVYDYIKNYGPESMSMTADLIRRYSKHEDDEVNTELQIMYVVQMSLLAKQLDKHFKGKEGSKKSFFRLADRSPEGMFDDYTLPHNKKNYNGDDTIIDLVVIENGEPVYANTENDSKKFETTSLKVRHLVEKDLNISGGAGTTKPIALVESILPRNQFEKSGQASEANINAELKKERFKDDTHLVNNNDISNINALFVNADAQRKSEVWEDDLFKIVNELKVQSSFDGATKKDESVLLYDDLSNSTKDIDKFANGIINKLTDAEYNRQMADEEVSNEIINKEAIKDGIRKKKKTIEMILNVKAIAAETSDVLLSQGYTLINFAYNHLQGDQASLQEVLGKAEKLLEKGYALRKGDINDVLREFRSVDYNDAEVIKTINELFYDPVRDTYQDYKDDLTKLQEKWSGDEYILTKEKNPESFQFRSEADDNIPMLMSVVTELLYNTNQELINEDLKDLDINFRPRDVKIINRIEKELKQNGVDLTDAEITSTALELYRDAKALNARRFNMNQKLYQTGHTLGLQGFEKPLSEATAKEVFYAGGALRSTLRRQYEHKLRRISENFEINFVDYETPELAFDMDGKKVLFEDILAFVNPSLESNGNVFNFSLNNFKENIKSEQVSAINSLENALKIKYIKDPAKKGMVEEALVLSALGEVSGNSVIYNDHYDSDRLFDENTKIQSGTESAVRYINNAGKQITVYGKYLGKRKITKKIIDEGGNSKTETSDYVFIEGIKNDSGGNLHMIKANAFQDLITGDPFSGKRSQRSRLDQAYKDYYKNKANELIDDLAGAISANGLFATREMEFKNRPDAIESEYKSHVFKNAGNTFSNHVLDITDNINKTFASRLKVLQDIANGYNIAKTYLGANSLMTASIGLGLAGVSAFSSMPTLFLAGLSTSGLVVANRMRANNTEKSTSKDDNARRLTLTSIGGLALTGVLGGPLGTVGAGMALGGVASYASRASRVLFSNALGTFSWIARNTGGSQGVDASIIDKFAFSMATKEMINTMVDAFNKSRNKQNNVKGQEQQASINMTQLSEGNRNSRSVDMNTGLDMDIFGRKQAKDLTILKTNKKRKLTKESLEIHKKLTEELRKYSKLNPTSEAVMQEFLDQMIEKYSSGKHKIEFIDNIPFVNGKSMTHYEQVELSLMGMATYFLSWKGKVMDMELISYNNAQNRINDVLTKHILELQERNKEFLEDENLFLDNLTKQLVEKSIGNYNKSEPQRKFLNSIMERFSRFKNVSTTDQTIYLRERQKFYNGVMDELKKDKGFTAFKNHILKLGGIPTGGYKVQNHRIEASINFTHFVMMQAMRFGSMAAISGAYQIGREFDETVDELGVNLFMSDLANAAMSIVSLLFLQNDTYPTPELVKVKRDIGNILTGPMGFGGTAPTTSLGMMAQILLYGAWLDYFEDLPSGQRDTMQKHLDNGMVDELGNFFDTFVPGDLKQARRMVEKYQKEAAKIDSGNPGGKWNKE